MVILPILAGFVIGIIWVGLVASVFRLVASLIRGRAVVGAIRLAVCIILAGIVIRTIRLGTRIIRVGIIRLPVRIAGIMRLAVGAVLTDLPNRFHSSH